MSEMTRSTSASPLPLDARPAAPALVLRHRLPWADAARGIGIVLVVFGHAADGLLNARLASRDGAIGAAYYAIYTFHMPVFFVLAALFVRERIGRSGFVADALARIAWPYVLWSVVQLALIAALGSAVNAPLSLNGERLLALLWQPTSQFWFLHALLVLHLATAWLLPRTGVAPLLAALAVARLVVEVVPLPPALEMPARFGVWYALGLAAAPWLRETLPAWPRRRMAGIAAAAAALGALVIALGWAGGRSAWNVAALPAALCGTAALIAAALLLRGTAARVAVALGQASMAIYVLHVMFVAGVRIVMHRAFGIDDALLIAAVATAAGIAGPLVARELALRAGAARALGLG